jgi:uncharacterized membrane protein
MSNDRGSTVPLIFGFFLVAALVVAAAVALGQAFVQQRNLQDICDGAAAAVAASAAELDRGAGVAPATSLRFGDVQRAVEAYLARDAARHAVQITASVSGDRRRIALRCEQTLPLTLGALFGRARVHHIATSSARAAVVG